MRLLGIAEAFDNRDWIIQAAPPASLTVSLYRRDRDRLQSHLMPVPGYQEFMRPLLEALSDGREQNVRAAYSTVADR